METSHNLMLNLERLNTSIHIFYTTDFVTFHRDIPRAYAHLCVHKLTEWRAGGSSPKYLQCLSLGGEIPGDVTVFLWITVNSPHFQQWTCAIIIVGKTDILETTGEGK